MAPSTGWKEQIAADEAARFEGYADQLAAMQRARSEKQGAGRALHRKQVLAAKARLAVLPDLPEAARHGLFARAGEYDAWIRLSNGNWNVQSDRRPDIRGFSIRVLGVEGAGALGGPTHAQDFLLINRETFGFHGPDEFIGLVLSAVKSPLALIGFFIRQFGFFGGLKRLRELARSQSAPFTGFATERFFSAAPIACGPYAARVRLLPGAAAPLPASGDFAADVREHLARGPLTHELQLQFFVDDTVTPIENGEINWPEDKSPYLTVARLTVPQQDLSDENFAKQVEASTFDPWEALADHRPLGSIMRARKHAYFKSQKGRGL